MAKTFCIIPLIIILFLNGLAQDLNSLGGGVTLQGNIYAIEYDSLNNLLYIGGDMRAVNGVAVSNVACWDGTTWTDLNGGMDGSVRSLKLVNHQLFVGGYFQNAGGVSVSNIASWDGVSWSSPGQGLPYVTISIELFHDTIYTAGYPNGGSTIYLSSFYNSTWNYGIMEFDNIVNGMTATDSALFIYGKFNHVNADTAFGFVSYIGASKFIYPPMFNLGISSIAFLDSAIYVAGHYKSVAAHWSSGTWHTDSLAPNTEEIKFIYNYKDTLYVISDGGFSSMRLHIKKIVNGQASPSIASMFYSITSQQGINTVYSSKSKLFLGSNLTYFGDSVSICLYEYDGITWSNPGKPSYLSRLGSSDYTSVETLVRDSMTGDIIAGGDFYFAGTQFSPFVSRWDGTKWNSMGSGFSGRVTKLIYFNNELYAVGYFSRSGGNWVGRIAKWDGNDWMALGTGANHVILDAIVYRNELYVGGEFDTINGIPANFCAKFDGTNWSAVANNILDDAVSQLYIYNDTLIAGSQDGFNNSFPDRTKFARYGGGSWMAMGINAGFSDEVTSMLEFNGQLFACIDKSRITQIWEWDGLNWIFLNSIGGNYTFSGRLYNFHNQMAASAVNAGFYLYDGSSFNKVSDIDPLCILNESATKDYIGGIIASTYFGPHQIEINNIGTLDFSLPQVSISMTEDTICERQYEFYHATSHDPFATISWHFPGGLPDTLSGAWDPIIQYNTPGNFNGYLVASNLVGTDTIYFSSPLIVLPCLTDIEELEISWIDVFPNPVASTLFINSKYPLKELHITDISGKIIKQWKDNYNPESLDLSELATGIYILTCSSNQGTRSFKIFKK